MLPRKPSLDVCVTLETSGVNLCVRVAQIWRSGVKIEKCRYLETSGCVGMCTNLCKVTDSALNCNSHLAYCRDSFLRGDVSMHLAPA